MSEVARILSAIEQGDPRAAEQLLPLVYDELRKLASAKLAQEKPGQTLQATALVHEAYVRIIGPRDVGGPREGEAVAAGRHKPRAEPQQWNSRGHFFGAAAEAMRRILVEKARHKQRLKHGGQQRQVDLNESLAAVTDNNDMVLAVDECLAALADQSPQAAQLV